MSDGTVILPSDSDLRPDIQPMIQGNWKEAEHQKFTMEEMQRFDRKLREAGEAKRASGPDDDYD